MALNLSALSNATNKATSLANLILVSPKQTVGYQAQNVPSWKRDTAALPKALLFNYEGEQSARLSSDITDHYIEDNTAVQDQIAIKPIQITTQGFIGELNDVAPAALAPLKEAAEKLTAISAYTPSLSTTALLAYANAFQAYQVAKTVLNSASSAWASINGSSGASVINGSGLTSEASNQTQQQIYFQQFYAYWIKRQLFTIQTPWAIFQDMAIMDLQAVQNAETRMITDFTITFKQLRFASTLTVENSFYDNNNFEGRAFNQGANETNLGTSTLEVSSINFSSVLAA